MKLHNYLFLSLLISLASIMPVKADTNLPKKVDVFCPEVLSHRIIYQHDIDNLTEYNNWGQNDKPREKKHWIAISDRDNNTTYSSPAVGAPFGKLDFNDKVIIAKIENGFALVYTDSEYKVWPKHGADAISKGWVPMENLVLWPSSPLNDKGIASKAILTLNLDSDVNSDLGYSYKNPAEKANGSRLRTGMTFYYVMKTDPQTGLRLLATQSRLDGNADCVLYGWVDQNSFVLWNNRLCLEPNWRPKDVKHFNDPDGKLYPIYPDPEMQQKPAAYYRYGVKNPDDKLSSSYYRMNAYQIRFPLLDPDPSMADKNIYKVATLGNSVSSGYVPKKDPQGRDYWKVVAFMSSEEFEGLMDRLENVYRNARPDGDRKPYIDAVKALIRVMVPDITEKEMDEMGIDQVMRLAAGLNESSDAVKGHSLNEIQDARVVPNDEYKILINNFAKKYRNLRDNVMKKKDYVYSYKSLNGQKFYWIPVEDLP